MKRMNGWRIDTTADLLRPDDPCVSARAPAATGDALGHTWRVTVLEGGEPAALDGCRAVGYFLRPDGQTVAVAGTVRGNVCEVTLTADCCAHAGYVRGLFRLTRGAGTVTLAELLLRVEGSGEDGVLAESETLPSLSALTKLARETEAEYDTLARRVTVLEGRVTDNTAYAADALNETVLWTGAVNGTGGTIALNEAATAFDAITVAWTFGGEQWQTFVPKAGGTVTLRAVDLADTPAAGSVGLSAAVLRLKLSANAKTMTVQTAAWMNWSGGSSARATGGTAAQGDDGSAAGVITRVIGRRNVRSEEVTDLRIAADGTVYSSAGDAVRTELTAMAREIESIRSKLRLGSVEWGVKELTDLLCPKLEAHGRVLRFTPVAGYPVSVRTASEAVITVSGRNLLDVADIEAHGETIVRGAGERIRALPEGTYTVSAFAASGGALALRSGDSVLASAVSDTDGSIALTFTVPEDGMPCEVYAIGSGAFSCFQLEAGGVATAYEAPWHRVYTADTDGNAEIPTERGGLTLLSESEMFVFVRTMP